MFLNNIIKFIFPNRCVICDTVLPFGNKIENEYLCDLCRNKIEFIKEPTCKKCGAMIYDDRDIFCTRCESHMHENFDYGFGLLRYNDAVKESLHRIKYSGRKEYMEFYGKCIAKVYHDKIKAINPDYLVPVPIHKKRLIKRNYNQASILANAISKELLNFNIEIEVNENLVFRKKNTKVLNKLDNEDRIFELDNAFSCEKCQGIEKVIIIDDIYTTGTTINKIASLLKKSGVFNVYFITICVVDNL